jgi:hypothetical protein
MTFKPGYHPTHDMAAAARKGKSPWRGGNIGTMGSLKTQQILRNKKGKRK